VVSAGSRLDLLSFTSDELAEAARSRLSSGAGIALDVFREAHLRGRFEPESHGVSASSAAGWRAAFGLRLPEVVKLVEEGETVKAVLRLHDGLEIEAVRIPMANQNYTLCLSSQVGCKMGCKFCETGLMGIIRDLSAGEIVSEVVVAQSVLGFDIKNLVFMGMGEALDNADAVLQALRVLNDKRGLDYGQQRITICTVGSVPGLTRLRALGWKRLNVAVSLNAATDELRSALMPVNRRTPLSELLVALKAYPLRRNFVYAVNYCLLPGVNDRREDSRAVGVFVSELGRALVNLIPYNPGSVPITRAPNEDDIARFIRWLEEDGVPVRRRHSKGRGVMAACGQLGNPELRQSEAAKKVKAVLKEQSRLRALARESSGGA
jgi:23S rRNA (adenine2503-C2)-methyltransferase